MNQYEPDLQQQDDQNKHNELPNPRMPEENLERRERAWTEERREQSMDLPALQKVQLVEQNFRIEADSHPLQLMRLEDDLLQGKKWLI